MLFAFNEENKIKKIKSQNNGVLKKEEREVCVLKGHQKKWEIMS
jgi:hypothetical protein